MEVTVVCSTFKDLTTLPDEIGERKELRWLNARMETTLPDEIGELKELENASCGWKSCNIGRNEKRCENMPCPQNRDFEEHLCLFKHGSPLYSGLPSKTVA